MLAIIAGVLTSLAFASSTLTSARASRLAGPIPVVAGVMFVGLIIVSPITLLASPVPADPRITPLTFVLAALGGAANITGLLLIYSGLRIGTIGVVSTIASTEGAIAAVVSVVAGQALAAGAGLVLALIAFGVLLAASDRGEATEGDVRIPRAQALRSAGFAAAAATIFGLGLFVTGQASELLPPAWVILPGRIIGVVALTVPLVLSGRLKVPRAAIPFVVMTGITEVVGFWLYAIGARSDIALTAVLSSMFAPIAAVAAFILFRERLARIQVLGIAIVVVGVATLGWLSA
jgi:drug/metabolite transporter (DMT)-like permease